MADTARTVRALILITAIVFGAVAIRPLPGWYRQYSILRRAAGYMRLDAPGSLAGSAGTLFSMPL